jgi:alkylated DNA repair dioxygenase AlkB
MQLDFFDTPFSSVSNPIPHIRGLNVVQNFISDQEQSFLVDAIDNELWLSDIKRRVQHYGYKYDYKKRTLDYSMYLGDLPRWSHLICNRLIDNGHLKRYPEQIIVNEYLPGQGIADHIDCEPCFEETIISLSLLSPCIMELKEANNKKNKFDILLEPKSLIVISDDSRYKWTHGIPAREKDLWNGRLVFRKRRISLTFRNVILQASK